MFFRHFFDQRSRELIEHLTNVVIAAPYLKEMQIACAQFHITKPFNHKNRNPLRLTEHPFSHPSSLRLLKYHLLSTSIPLSFKPLPTTKKAFPNPPVIAESRDPGLRDLLVHSTLALEIPPANDPQELKDATTHPASLVHFYERVKQTIIFLKLTIILRNFEEVSKYNLSQFGGTFSVDLYMLCCYCSVKQFYTLTRIFIVNRQTIKPF